ncbi:MAG: hypothetical protein PWR01_4203, partial [Clostridiales bacterium]|jgi:predicted PurR-regulated permease PerM|nr:hypothetical protein [Clostridiales bacterium]MDN5283130.1 hypothetical protein [Candidatus Ozemobacter sp.]
MLLAVPITVILKVLGKELYSELYDQVEVTGQVQNES